ncbi:MAG TPA: carboxymuconolactone decarboxylase family protein [Methylomirabilota bacterium]|nr:carboxymuconolactone decarboxylase family protein [Methylomirabilota bacterium]
MATKTPKPGRIPGRYLEFQKTYPKVFEAYDALGRSTQEAGPLPPKTRALVKLALAAGAQLEGAVHSHTRRAVEAGCTADELRHVVLLATTTLGFPEMMATMSWVDDVLRPAD